MLGYTTGVPHGWEVVVLNMLACARPMTNKLDDQMWLAEVYRAYVLSWGLSHRYQMKGLSC